MDAESTHPRICMELLIDRQTKRNLGTGGPHIGAPIRDPQEAGPPWSYDGIPSVAHAIAAWTSNGHCRRTNRLQGETYYFCGAKRTSIFNPQQYLGKPGTLKAGHGCCG